MSRLQDALDRWESLGYVRQQELGWMYPIVNAARKYANPDYKAAAKVEAEMRPGVGPVTDRKRVKAIVDVALRVTEVV